MNIERVREVALSMKYVEECTPFGEDNLVYKVGGKIFAMLSLGEDHRLNVKCCPERAIELREKYPEAIFPGYHMNKRHWNSVYVDILDDEIVITQIKHSYDIVYSSLTRKQKEEMV